jgi:hypothetical protein
VIGSIYIYIGVIYCIFNIAYVSNLDADLNVCSCLFQQQELCNLYANLGGSSILSFIVIRLCSYM